MTAEQLQLNLEFLRRTDIKGQEAPAFMQLIQAIQQELEMLKKEEDNGQ